MAGRAGGLPIIATEQIIHTIDQFGGSIQLPIAANWWVDGHLGYLHRHAPGVGDTGGGAIRFSGLLFSNVAFTAGFDVNESFLIQCRGHVHLRSYAWAMVQAYRLLEPRKSARHPAATRPLRTVRAGALRTAGGRPGFDREPARHPRRHCA